MGRGWAVEWILEDENPGGGGSLDGREIIHSLID